MKLLDRLVLKDLLPMFGVGVAFFSIIWTMGGPVLAASSFLSEGIPWSIVIKLIGLSLPTIVALTIPMGMLLAALLGFGRLSGNSESVALFAGGIPFLRIAAPAAALGLLGTLAAYLLNDGVAANATKAYNDLKATALQQVAPEHERFSFDVTDSGHFWQVTVSKGYDPETQSLRQVTIVTYDDKGNANSVLSAAGARFYGGKRWELEEVHGVDLGENPMFWYLPNRTVILLTPQGMGLTQQDPNTLDFRHLTRKIQAMRLSGASLTTIRDDEVTLWSKLALPFSCLVFAVIGAPLGLQRNRQSRETGWGLSILIIFAYYVIYTVMSFVARSGQCAPVLAVFLPNILGLGVGGFLSWKASAF